jgi:hypothetical protein
MLILGLLLLAATGSFVGLLISDNLSGGPDYTATVLGNTVTTLNSLAIFCAGLALALIFGLGLAMILLSAARRRRRGGTYDRTLEEPVEDTGHRRRRTRHIFGH